MLSFSQHLSRLEEFFDSSKQTLRDRNNIIIGFIETDSNGLLKLINRKDKILGFYDPKKNMTTDRLGIKIGTGNLLPTLIENVNESLLEYHKTLNQKLFDGEILRPEVRMTLLKIAETWQKFSKIPNDIVKDIIFTGGNAQYNYTKYSDIDVHIVIDKKVLTGKSDPDLIDDYLSDKKTLWSKSRNIKVRGYTVELYAQDVDDKLVASGVYSLLNNKWVLKPEHGKYDFKHDDALKNKVDEFTDTINNMIEKELPDHEFKIMKDKLKNMRKAALASGSEFSFDNLVFKSLRNNGILDKMNKYLAQKQDNELSLESKDYKELNLGTNLGKTDSKALTKFWSQKGEVHKERPYGIRG